MKRAQISIEYLILIAAVLAIVALVVAIATNIFTGNQSDLQFQMCRNAAASCALNLKTNPDASCNSCMDQCKDVRDDTDILTGEPMEIACSNKNSACGLCKQGKPNAIQEDAVYTYDTSTSDTSNTDSNSADTDEESSGENVLDSWSNDPSVGEPPTPN